MLTSHVVLDFITMGLDTYNTSQDGRFDVSVNFAGTLNSALNNYTSDHPVLPLGQLYGPPASCISLGFVQLDPNMFNLSHFDVRAFLVVMLCLSTSQGAGLHYLYQTAFLVCPYVPGCLWRMNWMRSNFTSNGMPSVQTRRFSGYQRTLCWAPRLWLPPAKIRRKMSRVLWGIATSLNARYGDSIYPCNLVAL
jgi:hypothetical protein